jgi:hypothetical protein
MQNELPPLRRVITGLDAAGRSVFAEDKAAVARTNPARPGWRLAQVWATGQAPARVDDLDRTPELHGVLPPSGGSVLNIIDFPPEPKDQAERERALKAMKDYVISTGVQPEPGLRRSPGGPHPRMHESNTIDYAIVLAGEIYAIMDNGEKLLKTGDVLIQRGTNHAWSNRSDSYCRMAFVLVDAKR